MHHTQGNHTETNDSNYKHVNATAELIMHLTNSAEPRVGDGILRKGGEILLNPSSLGDTKNENMSTMMAVSENMKCSDQAVNKLNASVDKVQRNEDIYSTHVSERDGLNYKKDDSVVIAEDEMQNHINDQVDETLEAKSIRNSLVQKTKFAQTTDTTPTNATQQTNLYAKLGDDKYACKIVGMCITKQGLALLADLNNNKLKVFTTTNIPLSYITIPRGPLSVALMDEVTALVGRQDKHIDVIDIADAKQEKNIDVIDVADENLKSMKVTETIKLAYKILGLTTCSGNIVVTTLGEPKCVKMLKLSGEELWSITTDLQGGQMFEAPEYIISYGLEDKTIVVSDYRKETLSFISGKTGTILKTLDMQGTGPEGIAIDSYNNLFVASFDRNEISCISENDGKIQTVLSWKNWRETLLETFARIRSINCKEGPLAVAYNCFTNELFVSYNPSDFVDRFTLTKG